MIPEYILLLLNGLLVLVTGYYAFQAWRMADAAKAQADAGMRAVEEMKNGRLFATEPVLVPTVSGSQVNWVEVSLKNTGRGCAYNVRCIVKHAAFDMAGKKVSLPSLGIGEHYAQGLHADPGAPEYHGAPIECYYEDMYGNTKFSTSQDGVLKTGWLTEGNGS
ncbi:MAG: hypothetical protein Q7R39_19585 [Dehalococcoidia bacterium]|nr:hypothetical protein [Dehalococcoidia bacterium]